jgi:hypothetical protein
MSARVLSAHDDAADGWGVGVGSTALGDGDGRPGEELTAGAEDGLAPVAGDDAVGPAELAQPPIRATTASIESKRAGERPPRPMLITLLRRNTRVSL